MQTRIYINNLTENKKRNAFKKILYDLAESTDVLKDPKRRIEFYKRFERIYHLSNNENFHHFYSDIFIVLTTINADPKRGNILYLGTNMSYIRENYQAKNQDSQTGEIIDISSNLRKLYDHISLDIARILYSEKGDMKFSGEPKIKELNSDLDFIKQEMSQLKPQIKNAQENTDKFNSEIKELQEELNSSKKEYVAILGIFSGIVLAFIGGLVFSNSVLENMHYSSIYRTLLVVLIIFALVLNALFISFRAIDKIVANNKRRFGTISWIITNSIILIALILIGISWKLGYVEKRNNTILNASFSVSVVLM